MANANTIWVVVCDGGSSRTFVNRGTRAKPDLEVVKELEVDNPPTRAQGTDKPGRFDDPIHGKSAVQDTDWHDQTKDRFTERIAEQINDAALKGTFANLVIYADATTLGRLRPRLHQEAVSRIAFEEALDLTNAPAHEIEERVKHVLRDTA